MSPTEFPTENVEYSCLKPAAIHAEPIDHRCIDTLNICKMKRLTVQLVNLDLNQTKGNRHYQEGIAHKKGKVKEMLSRKRRIKKQNGFYSQKRKFSANRNGGLKKKVTKFPAPYSLNNMSQNNDRFSHKIGKNRCNYHTFETPTPKGELRILLERLTEKEMKQYSLSNKTIIVPKVILHRLTLNEIGKYNISTQIYRGKQIVTKDNKKRLLAPHTEKCGINKRKVKFQRRMKNDTKTFSFEGLISDKCKDEDLMKHSCTDFVPQKKKGSATPKEKLRNWELCKYGWTIQTLIEKKRKNILVCEECKKREVQYDVDKSKVSRKLAQLMKSLSLRGTDSPVTRSLCVCGQLFI